jgi:hypothetical protein
LSNFLPRPASCPAAKQDCIFNSHGHNPASKSIL